MRMFNDFLHFIDSWSLIESRTYQVSVYIDSDA